MTKKLFKNKYFLILFIIALILIIFKIISLQPSKKNPSPSTGSTNQQPSLSNTDSNSIPNPTPTIQITEVNYQIPLNRLLPYRGKYFEIKRYHRANNLEVKVFGRENTELAKQELQEWLVKNGVDTLDTFTIIY